jgi:uncharacterized protein YjbI with pentapeptide repeats
LHGAGFSDARLKGANFAGTDLAGIDFHGANVDKADFSNTNLRGANLSLLGKADRANFAGAAYDATTLLDPKIDVSQMRFVADPALAFAAQVPSLSGAGATVLIGLLLASGVRHRSPRGAATD